MRRHRPRLRADDDGAYLILYAVLAVALFTLGAIVLDIAALRQDRSGDRLAADLAATAGAARLDRGSPSSARLACDDAWSYFLDNIPDASPVSPPDCATTFAPAPCDDLTPPATVTGTAGPFTVEITTPVPAGSSLMEADVPGGDRAQAIDPAIDGHQCERLAIRVLRDRQQPFSGIVGLGARQTDVHSVARSATAVASGQITELAVLDPAGCGVLRTEDSVRVEVAGSGQTGDVAVDSDGSGCGGASEVIAVDNGTELHATAGISQGVIRSVALTGPYPGAAFDPADVSAGRLSPVPVPSAAGAGRAAVDRRYNCVSVSCPPGQDHIAQLRSSVGTGVPASYLGIPVLPYVGPCAALAPTVIPAGNWYVPCPLFSVASDVTFEGGLLVFQGGVEVASGGCLAVADTGCGALVALPLDSIVFLQSGDLVVRDGADVSLQRTFVHLSGDAATTGSGRLQLGDPGATGLRRLTAPVAGDFEDLLVWAEAGDAMSAEGQPPSLVEGVLFTPHAELRLTPRGGATTLAAQIVTGRLRVTGSGVLTVSPSADRAVSNTARSVRLLR